MEFTNLLRTVFGVHSRHHHHCGREYYNIRSHYTRLILSAKWKQFSFQLFFFGKQGREANQTKSLFTFGRFSASHCYTFCSFPERNKTKIWSTDLNCCFLMQCFNTQREERKDGISRVDVNFNSLIISISRVYACVHDFNQIELNWIQFWQIVTICVKQNLHNGKQHSIMVYLI